MERERLDLRVVGGGQRQQAHLLVPSRVHVRLHRGEHRRGVVLAHRPVPVPRLAEAAPLRAPAHDLHPEAVLHDLDGGHDRLRGNVRGVELLGEHAEHRERRLAIEGFERPALGRRRRRDPAE